MAIEALLEGGPSLSFEVFPPKLDRPAAPLLATLERLYEFSPDFVSCTYGAGGSNRGRSHEICAAIAGGGACDALAHFTCVGGERESIASDAAEYLSSGVRCMLALRGDLPKGWSGTRGDFLHANELIAYLRKTRPELILGAACYPEKHLLAPDEDSDIDALLLKQSAGASFAISQLCYDPDAYARFIERARARGFALPVAAGVMPVLSRDGLVRMTLSNGCSIPAALSAIVGRYGEDAESFKKAGVEYTAALIDRLLGEDVAGIHLYTLNNRDDAAEVLALSSLMERRGR